ncbi:LiaF domain-containing protein [Lysinibacillus sp. LZ02]|uniref:LiaF domain-containing protein n=1 Tax=Lysinibacillus sp. LZ02 TaxID=3420668 RepID=UPI003D36B942
MKNTILIIIGLIIFIELFLFHNGGVWFLLFAFALYRLSVRKGEKMYAVAALIFFLLALLSMVTVRWLIPVAVIYWLYTRHRKELYVAGPYMTPEKPYAWQQQAVTRLFGNITIDATNTILPLEPTFISIFQGIGKTTIFVPYDVACTIVVNQGFGKVLINGHVTDAKKQVLLDQGARRTCMIHVSNGLGEVEIWQK